MGRVIAWLREERDMTQAELARSVDVHPTTLSKYENLGRIPEDVFLRICKTLTSHPDVIIEATLRLVGKDLRDAIGKAGEDERIETKEGEARPALAQLRQLYDARAAADREWTFALLRYFGADLKAPSPEDLAGLPLRKPRKRRRPAK
jgi:transcriptional regulator with XRE-family HTH domain